MNEMCSNPKLKVDYPHAFGDKAIENFKVPPRVECATCGRRVKPYVIDCEYPYKPSCLHIQIPPHKVKGWLKRPKKKSRRTK